MPANSDLQLRKTCFDKNHDRLLWTPGCETANLVERNGRLVQVGGPPMDACNVGELGRMGFAMPYEVGFVIDLDTIDNIPRGCGNLDGPWIKQYAKPACAQKKQWSCGDLARY